jgi:hypothetical protein
MVSYQDFRAFCLGAQRSDEAHGNSIDQIHQSMPLALERDKSQMKKTLPNSASSHHALNEIFQTKNSTTAMN